MDAEDRFEAFLFSGIHLTEIQHMRDEAVVEVLVELWFEIREALAPALQ
jgi:hypothetical protein